MTTSQTYRLKFIADDAFIQQLKSYAAQDPKNLKIESEKEDEDATRLGFDIGGPILAVVTKISKELFTETLAKKILEWLPNSKSNKIIVQTPFGTYELRKNGKITEEDVRNFLHTVGEMYLWAFN